MNKTTSLTALLLTLFLCVSCGKKGDILENTTWQRISNWGSQQQQGGNIYESIEFGTNNRVTSSQISSNGVKTNTNWTGTYRLEGNTIICSVVDRSDNRSTMRFRFEMQQNQIRDITNPNSHEVWIYTRQ
jgi:hypothetical protein